MLMQTIENLVCWCSILEPKFPMKQTSTYSSSVYLKTQLDLNSLTDLQAPLRPEWGQQNYSGDRYYSFECGADIKFYSTSSTNASNICTWFGA